MPSMGTQTRRAVTRAGSTFGAAGTGPTATVTAGDGVGVAVHLLGGGGRELMLAHATGFHGRTWGPLADRLADGFLCVAPDLRGHGGVRCPVTLARGARSEAYQPELFEQLAGRLLRAGSEALPDLSHLGPGGSRRRGRLHPADLRLAGARPRE